MLRREVVALLMAKEARTPQGEMLLTRALIPGEKTVKGKASKLEPLVAGGVCFRKDGGSASNALTAKTEEDPEFLLQLSQPRHCSHLLK